MNSSSWSPCWRRTSSALRHPSRSLPTKSTPSSSQTASRRASRYATAVPTVYGAKCTRTIATSLTWTSNTSCALSSSPLRNGPVPCRRKRIPVYSSIPASPAISRRGPAAWSTISIPLRTTVTRASTCRCSTGPVPGRSCILPPRGCTAIPASAALWNVTRAGWSASRQCFRI